MRSYLLILSLLCQVCCAGQQVRVYTAESHDASGTLSIPRFNPSLGHLIKADLEVSLDSYFFVIATPVVPTPFDAVLTITSDAEVPGMIDEFHQIYDYATFGVPLPIIVGIGQSYSASDKFRGSRLSEVTGTGTLDFQFVSEAHYEPDTVADMSVDVDHRNVTVSITYTYN